MAFKSVLSARIQSVMWRTDLARSSETYDLRKSVILPVGGGLKGWVVYRVFKRSLVTFATRVAGNEAQRNPEGLEISST